MRRWSQWGWATLLLSVCALGCGEEEQETTEQSFRTRQPFAEPEELVSSDGVLEVTLKSAPAELVVSGRPVHGEAYNKTFVGPTLRLEPGD